MIDYPNNLNIIFDKLDKFSIKPIIIGGYIRDKILNLDSKDIDIELYGIDSLLKLESILEEFGDVNSVGKSFGVCKLKVDDLDIDFSLPRTDSKVSQGHRGFSIQTDTTLDFKTATSRRDFTINAIGYDVIEKKILDPFDGREDLKNRVLKAVDILKFEEDPLRVLRAVQFAARFHFSLDEKLFIKCEDMIKRDCLNELAKERIFEEIAKLLLKSKKPSLGILLLKNLSGFLYFKEFSLLTTKEFEQTLLCLDYQASVSFDKKKITTMLCLLTYYHSKTDMLAFLKRLSDKKELTNELMLLKENQNSLDIYKSSDYDLYKLASNVDLELYLSILNAVTLAKKRDQILKLKKRARDLGILNTKAEELLKGRDLIKLGLKPSKEFSHLLKEAYEAQILGRFTTYEEATLWLKKSPIFRRLK
ncbi:MAG: CCA tRNA nucleotidyltransferase [Campylobacterota bacterium]|nr:CCA tRNA nucleotidyltransferase [Campylobacterota bacterium]